MLAILHRVVFQVEFRLLLAFLGPLEGSAVEKVRGMSLQYPTTGGAVYLCNGAVSEKSPQIFRPSLPVEYVTEFSGRTDAPKVRCDLTDTQTDRTTTVTLDAHARRGLMTLVTYAHAQTICRDEGKLVICHYFLPPCGSLNPQNQFLRNVRWSNSDSLLVSPCLSNSDSLLVSPCYTYTIFFLQLGNEQHYSAKPSAY